MLLLFRVRIERETLQLIKYIFVAVRLSGLQIVCTFCLVLIDLKYDISTFVELADVFV